MKTAKTKGIATSSEAKKKKADVTAERLLEISLRAFTENGFDETSMRGLAQAAGLSPGAFYYHYSSKEAVIQVFYEKSFESFLKAASQIFESTDNFSERVREIVRARLSTFTGSRDLLIVLSRSAVDPRSPLSPFGKEQKRLREATVRIMEELVKSSDLRCDKRLLPYLPYLLWMYTMGILFYWAFDESPKQNRTTRLIDSLTPQLARLIGFTRLPLTGSVLKPFLEVLELLLPETVRKSR